jgi:hypothetical protein
MKSNYPPSPDLLNVQFLGFGPGGPLPIPSPWTTYGGYIYYPQGVVLGSPTGGNLGAGIINAQDVAIQGTSVLNKFNNYLPTAGGTVTGNLIVNGNSILSTLNVTGQAFLAADPTQSLQAATKQYVDNNPLFVRKTGDTMTGALTIAPTSSGTTNLTLNKPAAGQSNTIWGQTGGKNRWTILLGNSNAESGSNVGSDFTVQAYDDTGALLGTPFFMWRPTGGFFCNAYGATLVTPSASPGGSGIGLNKAPGANMCILNSFNNGVGRWQMQIGNSTAESGSNTGSNFALIGMSDTGVALGTWLQINRNNGSAYFNSNPGNITLQAVAGVSVIYINSVGANAAQINLNKGASGGGTNILGLTNGSQRWVMSLGNGTAEGSGNVGSDFQLISCDNNGAGLASFTISRNSGNVQINASANNDAAFALNKPASGRNSEILSYTAGSLRWNVCPGNSAAETGSNVGSDFCIVRYGDNGVGIDWPFQIVRQTGAVTIPNALTVSGPTQINNGLNITPPTNASIGLYPTSSGFAQIQLSSRSDNSYLILNRPNGYNNLIIGRTGVPPGNNRWYICVGSGDAESGNNQGSHFYVQSWGDNNAILATPFMIYRNTSICNFAANINVGGTGVMYAAFSTGAYIAWYWNTSALYGYVNNVQLGYITWTSDYRIKRNIKPLSSMWEKVKALNPISYNQKEFSPPEYLKNLPAKNGTESEEEKSKEPDPLFREDNIEHWGFIAHDLQNDLVPAAATGYKDAPNIVQSVNPLTLLAGLTKALQEAMARIEILEGKLA